MFVCVCACASVSVFVCVCEIIHLSPVPVMQYSCGFCHIGDYRRRTKCWCGNDVDAVCRSVSTSSLWICIFQELMMMMMGVCVWGGRGSVGGYLGGASC